MKPTDYLFTVSPEEYGPEYNSHLLEQYKIYTEMTDRISARRQSANNFFLSINTALLAFLGIVQHQNKGFSKPWILVVCVAGMLLCYSWYRLIRSYKDINNAKFNIIHKIEVRLPAAPYGAEWTSVGKGQDPKLYLPFTNVELYIPWIFLGLYAVLLLFTIFLAKLY